ncbi:MAG TPA: ABC transporter ATP-binding protein [Cellvibrionaceae bacterium]
MLHVNQLTFGYRKQQPQLQDIAFDVDSGDILGLLGPNGAGKTTLVSLITGLLTPNAGSITLDGQPIALGNRQVGLVPQEYAFYPRLSGRENLAYFAGIVGLAGQAAHTAIDRALSLCALQAVQQQRAGEYSGGLKRRLNFAIALLTRPRLLILDEPTANVDPETRKLLLDIIRQLNREGMAIIYTSHLLGEVERLCNKVVLLYEGKLILSGAMGDLLGEEHQKIYLKLTAIPSPELLQSFQASRGDDNWWCFTLPPGTTPATLLSTLEAAHVDYSQLRYGTQRLEEVYLAITSGRRPAP